MTISTRHATVADAENIAVLSRQTFYDTFAAFNSKENMDKFMQESFSLEALMAEVSAAGNLFLMAFMEDELAGYAKLTDNKNPAVPAGDNAIEISRIYVAQKKIGLGVGKTLMQACISTAKEKNKQLIWLGVWEHNQRAISFYSKFGFEKFGEHDFLLGNDRQTDWLMKKTV